MAAEAIKGLTLIELAPNVAGTIGAYVAIGYTAKGSFQFVTAEGTKNDIFVEELSKAILTSTDEGPMTVTWDSLDVDPVKLTFIFGGTTVAAAGGVGRIWKAPRGVSDKICALRVTTGLGHVLKVTQLSVFPTFNATITGSDAAKFHVVGTVQNPSDGVTEPYSITYTT